MKIMALTPAEQVHVYMYVYASLYIATFNHEKHWSANPHQSEL